jgi:beta-glucosidase
MIRLFFSIISICIFINAKAQINVTYPEIEIRIDQFLSKMTLEEKVGQTCQITLDAILKRDNAFVVIEPIQIDTQKLIEALVQYRVGSILNVGSHTLSLKEWKYIQDNIHSYFKEKKTNVPIIYGIDAIHGVNYTIGATLSPHEIALAASWNPELAKQFGEVTAYETRASGIHWNFSPVLDLGRQPLWSRFFETLGEDPYLASEIGKAIVNGYQGKDKVDAYHVAACLKHFVGYSNPQSGRDRTPAWIPEKMMAELYLPPFKAAVEQGALTLMINSGDVNGVPGHMNYNLLTKTLKEDWGFKGFTVSDWEDFDFLHSVHNTADDIYDAIIKGFNAGVDMSMVPYSPQYKTYCELMTRALKEGKIKEERLNDAVRRILRVKLLIGLFETNRNQADNYSKFASDAHKKLAQEAALESITLLKNSNNTLPLSADKKVLLAGPCSDNLIFLNGAWTHTWQGDDAKYNTAGAKNIKEAFLQKLGKDKLLFSKGCELYLDKGYESSKLVNTQEFQKFAKKADVIVLALGEYPSTEKPGDIRSLNLTKEQLELAKMAFATKKPVVLLLSEARPRIIREIVDGASAIVHTYLPGDYGADALMKLLYGEADFSGRLPFTYQKYDGQIEFYDHPRSVAKSKAGSFDAFNPQWEFGYGLSYNMAEYKSLVLDKTAIKSGEAIKVSVKLQNKGKTSTKEVVQLYVSDLKASMVPAGKKLCAFQKVELKAGEERTIDFIISEKSLYFADSNGKMILEKGAFKFTVKNLSAEFKLD